jgi:hypothetical protein
MILKFKKNQILISILILLISFTSISSLPEVFSGNRTYDFQDMTNNEAFEGADSKPPLGRDIGTEIDSNEYDRISASNNQWAVYTAGPDSDQFDFHRFKFKILESPNIISQIYVEHEGYANGQDDYAPQDDGLGLYIWDDVIGQWIFMDEHGQGPTSPHQPPPEGGDGITSKTITENIDHYIDNDGYLYLLAQTKEVGESYCPLLYTYDGKQFVFVTDLYNRGILAVPNFPPQPEDYAKIESDQLNAENNRYKIQITQEFDEISYLDNIALIAVDHSSEVEVFPSLLKSEEGEVFTVSKDLSTPVSAIDETGESILAQISKKDGIYTSGKQYELDVMELDLGDLTTAKQVKLVISAYSSWDNSKVFDGIKKPVGRFVHVKDTQDNWIAVVKDFEMITPSALPRTYVLDLTDKFLSDEYSVRIGFYPDVRFDYIGIDTSPPQEFKTSILSMIDADLHFRGYSTFKGLPSLPDYDDYSSSTPLGYSHPTGNFTKFGEVSSLLEAKDDKFIILHHGDEISVDFEYLPVLEGMERDFFFYSWGYYKNPQASTGDTVEPLPFHGMSEYPYSKSESYPSDDEHLSYLKEYNTREYVYSNQSKDADTHNTIWTDYVKVEITTRGVGGFMMPVNKFMIFAPYLAFIGILVAMSIGYLVKKWKT